MGRTKKLLAPAPGAQWASVIEAPVGAHSVKPDAALEMIEHYYPNLPKIELHQTRTAPRGRAGKHGATKFEDSSSSSRPPSDKAPEQGGAEVEIIRAD